MEMLKCSFPGCNSKMQSEAANVPALSAIRNVTSKVVTIEELAKHVLCNRHSRAARSAGIKVFSYLGSVKQIEWRLAEREKAGKFFQLYGAFQRAGIGRPKPESPKQPSLSRLPTRVFFQ